MTGVHWRRSGVVARTDALPREQEDPPCLLYPPL